MEQRRIGSLSVSIVGLGCNNFGQRLDAQRTERVVWAALDAGIDFRRGARALNQHGAVAWLTFRAS